MTKQNDNMQVVQQLLDKANENLQHKNYNLARLQLTELLSYDIEDKKLLSNICNKAGALEIVKMKSLPKGSDELSNHWKDSYKYLSKAIEYNPNLCRAYLNMGHLNNMVSKELADIYLQEGLKHCDLHTCSLIIEYLEGESLTITEHVYI